MVIFFDAALKSAVLADFAVIVTVPTFFAETRPVVPFTVAIVESEDIKDLSPFAPEMETAAFWPTAILEAVVFTVIDCSALRILNVFVIEPL